MSVKRENLQGFNILSQLINSLFNKQVTTCFKDLYLLNNKTLKNTPTYELQLVKEYARKLRHMTGSFFGIARSLHTSKLN